MASTLEAKQLLCHYVASLHLIPTHRPDKDLFDAELCDAARHRSIDGRYNFTIQTNLVGQMLSGIGVLLDADFSLGDQPPFVIIARIFDTHYWTEAQIEAYIDTETGDERENRGSKAGKPIDVDQIDKSGVRSWTAVVSWLQAEATRSLCEAGYAEHVKTVLEDPHAAVAQYEHLPDKAYEEIKSKDLLDNETGETERQRAALARLQLEDMDNEIIRTIDEGPQAFADPLYDAYQAAVDDPNRHYVFKGFNTCSRPLSTVGSHTPAESQRGQVEPENDDPHLPVNESGRLGTTALNFPNSLQVGVTGNSQDLSINRHVSSFGRCATAIEKAKIGHEKMRMQPGGFNFQVGRNNLVFNQNANLALMNMFNGGFPPIPRFPQGPMTLGDIQSHAEQDTTHKIANRSINPMATYVDPLRSIEMQDRIFSNNRSPSPEPLFPFPEDELESPRPETIVPRNIRKNVTAGLRLIRTPSEVPRTQNDGGFPSSPLAQIQAVASSPSIDNMSPLAGRGQPLNSENSMFSLPRGSSARVATGLSRGQRPDMRGGQQRFSDLGRGKEGINYSRNNHVTQGARRDGLMADSNLMEQGPARGDKVGASNAVPPPLPPGLTRKPSFSGGIPPASNPLSYTFDSSAMCRVRAPTQSGHPGVPDITSTIRNSEPQIRHAMQAARRSVSRPANATPPNSTLATDSTRREPGRLPSQTAFVPLPFPGRRRPAQAQHPPRRKVSDQRLTQAQPIRDLSQGNNGSEVIKKRKQSTTNDLGLDEPPRKRANSAANNNPNSLDEGNDGLTGTIVVVPSSASHRVTARPVARQQSVTQMAAKALRDSTEPFVAKPSEQPGLSFKESQPALRKKPSMTKDTNNERSNARGDAIPSKKPISADKVSAKATTPTLPAKRPNKARKDSSIADDATDTAAMKKTPNANKLSSTEKVVSFPLASDPLDQKSVATRAKRIRAPSERKRLSDMSSQAVADVIATNPEEFDDDDGETQKPDGPRAFGARKKKSADDMAFNLSGKHKTKAELAKLLASIDKKVVDPKP